MGSRGKPEAARLVCSIRLLSHLTGPVVFISELFDITMLLWEKPISPFLSSFLFSFFLSGSRTVLTVPSLLFYLLRGRPTMWYCICTMGDLLRSMVLSAMSVLTAFYIYTIQPPFLSFCFDSFILKF